MKSYAAVAVFAILAVALVAADDKQQQQHMVASSYGGSSSGGSSYGSSAPAPSSSYGGSSSGGSSYGSSAPAPSSSYGGSSSGGSIPAPPCPKNYIFSCQPHLSPAPCAAQQASSGGYGSAGAYSENYPVYAVPAPLPYYGLY